MKKKKKVSVQEKLRRLNQNGSSQLYLDGQGNSFTMTKIKHGYKLND